MEKKRLMGSLFNRSVIFVVILLFFSFVQAKESIASALDGPQCSVKVEVVSISSEKKQLDSGRIHESHYAAFKVLEVTDGDPCPIKQGQVYRVINRASGVLKEGDKIVAGVEFASSMGPNGPVGFIQWSPLSYDDGSAIKNEKNVTVDFMQSSDMPINDVPKTIEEGIKPYIYIQESE